MDLRRKVLDYTCVDLNLEQVMLVSSPVVHFNQLDEAFGHLEVLVVRVTRDHHHKAECREHILRGHL